METLLHILVVLIAIPYVIWGYTITKQNRILLKGRFLFKSLFGAGNESYSYSSDHQSSRNKQSGPRDSASDGYSKYQNNGFESQYSTQGNTRHHSKFLKNLVEHFQPSGLFEQSMPSGYKYLTSKFLNYYHPIILNSEKSQYKEFYRLLLKETHPDRATKGFSGDELNKCFSYIKEKFPSS
ncbi:MAG: hypothetical protein JXR11_02570 [Balneola sp.]